MSMTTAMRPGSCGLLGTSSIVHPSIKRVVEAGTFEPRRPPPRGSGVLRTRQDGILRERVGDHLAARVNAGADEGRRHMLAEEGRRLGAPRRIAGSGGMPGRGGGRLPVGH